MDRLNAQITLIKKGAEASLFLAHWQGRRVIMKARLPKKYRHPKLDYTIRRQRTIRETQLLHEAKLSGVPTPTVFIVDVENTMITMDYIEGIQVKRYLEKEVSETKRRQLFAQIGELIAKLHRNGIIHGDLTTSNLILHNGGRVFMLDFGLGEKNEELEAKGVDLHLLKCAIQSTHFNLAETSFNNVIDGYKKTAGSPTTERVLDKIREIEKRGRYVAERKQNL